MLKQRCQDMSEMVLDLKMGKSGPLGIPGGVKIRMKVRDDEFRLDVKELSEVPDCFLEVCVILVFIQVSQKLAGDHISVLVNRDRILELSAECQNVTGAEKSFRYSLRIGDIAPGTSDEERLIVHDFDH